MTDIFTIKRGDTSPALRYTLWPPVDLTGSVVVFNMRPWPAGAVKVARAPATVVAPATASIVEYDWAAADTDTSGAWQGEFEVTHADGSIETYPNDSYLTIRIPGDIS